MAKAQLLKMHDNPREILVDQTKQGQCYLLHIDRNKWAVLMRLSRPNIADQTAKFAVIAVPAGTKGTGPGDTLDLNKRDWLAQPRRINVSYAL